MNEQNIPLNILIENAKIQFVNAFNSIAKDFGIPAYLVEGIILGILSDIRNQMITELTNEYNNTQKPEKEKEEKVGE